MFDNKLIAQDFSKAASQYDEHAVLQQNILQKLIARIEPKIESATKILDAGCGTGKFATLLPGKEIIGVDIAYDMCKIAEQNCSLSINADICNLPFGDAYFDIVISSAVLQWVEKPHLAIKEMQRVLKPGGTLAIATFGEKTLCELKSGFAIIDDYSHVSDFASSGESEIITQYFPNLNSIMQHLKAIGARNKMQNRRKGLMTRRQLQRIEDYYIANFSAEQGLRVTWQVDYMISTR
ncbi:MAG: methyltransferase domain-containing protein [Pseudomonadota bacterium]